MSAFVAAPLAGMTLAGLGCEVLRVDPPGGGLDYGRWPVTAGGDSIFWAGLNRGKRSVVVDFRREEGRELVASMVVADGPGGGVLLTNLGARGALCHDRLRERRPDVVSVQIEGFPGGRSAVDYTIAAQSGIPLVTGPQGHVGPVNSPLPTWDIAAGLNAAVAATEALRRRQRSGSGALVRVALSDVALGLLSSLGLVDEARLAVEPRSRDGNYLYGAFGRDFGLADGGRVMIVAITLKQWRSLVDALALAPEVAALERSRGLDLEREGDRFRARVRDRRTGRAVVRRPRFVRGGRDPRNAPCLVGAVRLCLGLCPLGGPRAPKRQPAEPAARCGPAEPAARCRPAERGLRCRSGARGRSAVPLR